LELLADDGSIRGRQGLGAVGQHLGSDLGAQAVDVTCSKAQRSIAISGWRRHPVSDSEVTDGGGGVAVADLSREEGKRLRAALAAAAPSGVVTFLFTDIEGSTRRWEADAQAMRAALVVHDKVLRTADRGA